jgi:hypothetical protein
MVEIESISSLFLPAGRQGRWGQAPPFLTGFIQIYTDVGNPVKKNKRDESWKHLFRDL